MVSGVAIQRSANVCFVPIADIWGKPWLKHRPQLTMLVVVHGRTNSGILSVDGAFDPNMREALANAAQRYGLPVGLPSATLQSNQISLDTTKVAPGDRLSKVAELSDGELPLFR